MSDLPLEILEVDAALHLLELEHCLDALVVLAQADQTNLELNVSLLLALALELYFHMDLCQLLAYLLKLILNFQAEVSHSVCLR